MRRSTSVFCVVSALCACVVLADRQATGRTDVQHLPLLPAYDVSQHAPQFQATVKNDTSHTLDIYRLYTQSTVALDGKIYPYAFSHTVFQGDPDLRPGKQWTYTMDLSQYVRGWKRLDYDMGQESWRWQSPLPTGKHTITLDMGGRQYGPVDFVWDADAPFEMHSSAKREPLLPNNGESRRRLAVSLQGFASAFLAPAGCGRG